MKVAGVNYVLPLGQSFNTQLNARTSLQGTNGKTIFAVVQSQLPALLDAPNYAVGFILTENEQGTDKTVPIYELGLSVNRTQIAEGGSLTATFTGRAAEVAAEISALMSPRTFCRPSVASIR